MSKVVFRPFVQADQSAVRALILSRLAARFGTLNKTPNPHLSDI